MVYRFYAYFTILLEYLEIDFINIILYYIRFDPIRQIRLKLF